MSQNQWQYHESQTWSQPNTRSDWEAYANTGWWGKVQPPTVTVTWTPPTAAGANVQLGIGWSQKITDPLTLLMEFLLANLCERLTLALVGGPLSLQILEELLQVPARGLSALIELLQFELNNEWVSLPKRHPLA